MSSRVLILDTSILCCWLRVPSKETAGSDDDQWDHARVDRLLTEERRKGSTFVLPIASLIETGNHIAQSAHSRYERAQELVSHLDDAASAVSPWAAFTDQSDLWSGGALQRLSDEWPALASQRMTIGDTTIKFVADYYSVAGFEVEIVTADAGLKAYEPRRPAVTPRRRS